MYTCKLVPPPHTCLHISENAQGKGQDCRQVRQIRHHSYSPLKTAFVLLDTGVTQGGGPWGGSSLPSTKKPGWGVCKSQVRAC